ncbi:DEAD/DEAH box helicase [Microbulbifer agarilyticus]|uniref:DEAD/DEAH box helicase n=1 Tax=Microbulbifer agarilyticus TaxID=260552 RepID=UPI001CD818B7|nr:DEAD/DEAH box helicase [Microbulbifer agarilyticus]MCA0893860.1 DEAD/DEAH box helicase [Microbulbifer agarilyticus]
MLKEIIEGNSIRETIALAISEIHRDGPENPETLEKLSLIKKYHSEIFSEYEARILSVMGLFYKTASPKSFVEAIYKNIGDTIEEQYGRAFTPMQASAYKSISEKEYYSFSAPTSTGKSHLFRELIKEYTDDIVIVVPSRALIAEFYSTVIELVDKEVLVLQFVENVNQHNTSRRIFIITPERGVELFKYADEFNICLFLFDEAQISEEPVRGISFDAFVRRVENSFPESKKVFAHPFVENPEAQLKKHNIQSNSKAQSFKQSNVGKIFVAREEDGSFSYFSPYSESPDVPIGYDIIKETLKDDGTALIYTSKSKIFNGGHIEGFGDYVDLCPTIENPGATKIIESLKKYIGSSNSELGKQSSFIQLLERGIVVHHGSMPLKARLIIENFVREGFAKLCFATSTLNQGINMPFDCVLIDNFHLMETLTLKNLIGRSGRSSNRNELDYGYTIVNRSNVSTFTSRINQEIILEETSRLDEELDNVPEDSLDLVEAIQSDSFNDELHLTNSQVDRIKDANLSSDIRYILDKLVDGNRTITAKQYYDLGNGVRKIVKRKLKKIYCAHLNRSSLNTPEQTVLSTSIPLLLWKIQGKSFSETLSLRHSYLTKRDERRELRNRLVKNEITQGQYNQLLREIKVKYSARAESLPNSRLSSAIPLFSQSTSVGDFDYDLLIYDTYDYLDKVISLSIADPISAALTVYFEESNDERAKVLKNYLRYGTNDEVEIWLLKYGFDPEDIEWIVDIVVHIDEAGIIFQDDISEIGEERVQIVSRYL